MLYYRLLLWSILLSACLVVTLWSSSLTEPWVCLRSKVSKVNIPLPRAVCGWRWQCDTVLSSDREREATGSGGGDLKGTDSANASLYGLLWSLPSSSCLVRIRDTLVFGQKESESESSVILLSIHISSGLHFFRLFDVLDKGLKPQLCQVLCYSRAKTMRMKTASYNALVHLILNSCLIVFQKMFCLAYNKWRK